MIKGNKGEWSEIYTFLKLLIEKQVTSADADLQKIDDYFFPILKIIRVESDIPTDYELMSGDRVRILRGGVEIDMVDCSDLRLKVVEIFNKLKVNTDTTFRIPSAEKVMDRFKVSRLNAGNSVKEDLTLKIHDRRTAGDHEVGFSIKSMLGSAATLLNASAATNFIFKINSLSPAKVSDINAIDTRAKIRDRLTAIIENGGRFSFVEVTSKIFEKNLRKVDAVLPEIVAELLLAYYSDMGNELADLVDKLGVDKEFKILNFNFDKSDYEYKIKSLLYNTALGMVSSTLWDGNLRAHGGYIIVREDGEIVCYHVYNADEFRNYLYKNTRFETPSSSRHGFGSIYEENGDLLLKLNLQIRFIK